MQRETINHTEYKHRCEVVVSQVCLRVRGRGVNDEQEP